MKKFYSLNAPKAIEDMKFNDFTARIVAYWKPAETLVIAERTMFITTAQGGSDETETDFMARLRAARYCKIETLKTSADLGAAMIRLQLLACLKDKEKNSSSHRQKQAQHKTFGNALDVARSLLMKGSNIQPSTRFAPHAKSKCTSRKFVAT